jgi:hypothetical protein
MFHSTFFQWFPVLVPTVRIRVRWAYELITLGVRNRSGACQFQENGQVADLGQHADLTECQNGCVQLPAGMQTHHSECVQVRVGMPTASSAQRVPQS